MLTFQTIPPKIDMRTFLKVFLFMPSLLLAQTAIYRSVQNNTSAIANGSAIFSLTISGTTATFSSPVPDTIGVGDAIIYNTVASICFIHGRTSPTVFTVASTSGGTPTAIVTDIGWQIFRSYTSLANWESRSENTGISITVRDFDTGTTRNISSNNEQWHVALYRGNAGIPDINGWTTGTANNNNYIRIFAPSLSSEVGLTQRHGGTKSLTKAHINVDSNSLFVEDNAHQVRFEGIQFIAVATTTVCLNFINFSANQHHYITACLFEGSLSPLNGDVAVFIQAGSGSSVVKISNNIIYNFRQTNGWGIRVNGSSWTVYLYNNTIHGCKQNFLQSSGTMIAKNNLSSGATILCFNGTFSSSEYNASSDATAPGTNSRTNQTFTFINSGSNNYLLASGDAGAKDFGKNLSGDANLAITTDIIRTSRPQGSAYDIGAHEVIVSAPLRRRVIPIH